MKEKLSSLRYGWEYRRARTAYEKAPASPFLLDRARFDALARDSGQIPAEPFQDYSIDAMKRQARERAKSLLFFACYWRNYELSMRVGSLNEYSL